MLKNIQKSRIVLFVIVLLMFLSPLCIASNAMTVNNSTNKVAGNIVDTDTSNEVTQGDTELTYQFIASDIYKFDDSIVVTEIVDGNAFLFGNNVTVSGEIGGDVFVFGQNVIFTDTSYVHGSIFVFGEKVTVNGICYDVYGACKTFTLDSDAIIARDLRLVAQDTIINGQIKKNAYIYTDSLIFAENAKNLIAGNLEYYSTSEFEIPEGIVIGELKYIPITSSEKTVSIVETITSYIRDIVSSIIYALAVVLLTIWLAPSFKEKAGNLLKKKAPLSLGIGLLTCIVVIVASIAILFITGGLGFGVSAAVITIWILSLTISKTVFAMACSKLITNKMNKNGNLLFILFTLLLVLAISILEIIPFVGGLLGFAISIIGLGIIVLNLIKKNKEEDKPASAKSEE